MKNLYEFLNRVSSIFWLGKTQIFYRPLFGKLGYRSRIISPLKLRNMENIYIGNKVTINKYTWLLTLPIYDNQTPKLVIGDGSEIGHFNHITCVNHVKIGPKVLTADRVHISDNSHGYEDTRKPIIDQPVISKGPVIIGEGSWLGENVSVLSCRVGRNCVIGANAVVVNDIPDYCVAAGIPAKVIKRFDRVSDRWKSI